MEEKDLEINLEGRVLRVSGAKGDVTIELPPQLSKLAGFFVRNKGSNLSEAELCQAVWGSELEGLIMDLRAQLGDYSGLITALPGYGYKLNVLAGVSSAKEEYHFGELFFYPEKRRVAIGGNEARLTKKECRALLYFSEHPNRFLSKAELYEAIWGESYQAEKEKGKLRTTILHIRAKLRGCDFIRYVKDYGYRFVVPRGSLSLESRLGFGELCIYPESERVFVGDREVNLTPGEYDLLLFLAKNPDRALLMEELYRAIGPRKKPERRDSNLLRTYLTSIRKKLGLAPSPIKNIHGVGYRFNPPET